MEQVIRKRVIVQPGGHIELTDDELEDGTEAEVVVIVGKRRASANSKQAALDVLNAQAGEQIFQTSSEADAYLLAERESWDH